MHTESYPPILYFGTPVVLISTLNDDDTSNLAPMSSIFWLGWRCMIGLSALSKTTENILRQKECVLNLPSVNEVSAVNRLALTTGSNPVPEGKLKKGYRYEPDKFALAQVTAEPSLVVHPPRVKECPVHLEAQMVGVYPLGDESPAQRGRILTFELSILKVHLSPSILMQGHPNKVDPDKWKPLIMSFQQFYGLTDRISPSTLSSIPEHAYQTPDWLAAQALPVKPIR